MNTHRVVTGVLITATVLGIFAIDHYWAAGFFSAALLSVIAYTAAVELCTALEAVGVFTFRRLTGLACFVVALAPAAGQRFWQSQDGFAAQAGVVFGFMILCFVMAMRGDDLARGAKAVAGGVFVVIYVGFSLSFLVRLRLVDQYGEVLLLLAIGCAKIGDSGAYFVGKAIGRHPLAPRLSPKKTVEGAFGALAGSSIAALILYPYLKPQLALGTIIVWALVLSVAGQFGDLAESLVKRAGGVKDSGATLGAMGGALDLVDSLLLSAPVAYILAITGGFGAIKG
jgi:phosphatidate cytidylyltransferase